MQDNMQSIESQIEYLVSGGIDILPSKKDLIEKLKLERPLRVKLGIDPTSPDLHLGHTVCLQLLRKFQNLRHQAVLIIGGFTACLGDPTGRNETRPPLTLEQVQVNAQTYLDQVSKVLDMSKVEIVNNSDWLSNMGFEDVIRLLSTTTVNQLIAKEAFGSRIDQGQPLYMHELLYPLMQGYDSVVVEADIELGGQDQRFNILTGRDLQRNANKSPQVAMLAPLLVGLDGSKKMSKSYGNSIGIADHPHDMYGKTMSLPDEMLLDWYGLVVSLPADEMQIIKSQISEKTINPRDLKMKLAKMLVELYYSADEAEQAEQNFIQKFQKREIPTDMPEYKISVDIQSISQLLAEAGLTPSNAEAKRKLQEGAVKLNGEKIDITFDISGLQSDDVLQVGKRAFIKIIK